VTCGGSTPWYAELEGATSTVRLGNGPNAVQPEYARSFARFPDNTIGLDVAVGMMREFQANRMFKKGLRMVPGECRLQARDLKSQFRQVPGLGLDQVSHERKDSGLRYSSFVADRRGGF
jgi:hypothetical protein